MIASVIVDVRPGTVVAEKYRVEKEIGRGGFGIVVKAKHLTLEQSVAIKILTKGDGNEADYAEDAARFRREAKAIARLRGEHVVRILDVDALPEGAPYIVMEHLEGQTLHHVTYTRGPLAIEEAVDYAIQILAALAEAHSVGIVHRDLKPANVFLARGAQGVSVVKVLDFGVSKLGGESVSQHMTRTGAVIGTVAYMAPEQMLDAKRVDGRADLFSVAEILYEALTKQLPFGAVSAPTIVTSILSKPPTPLSAHRPDIPAALEAIMLQCLEKDAAKRFQTAIDLALALEPFASRRARSALDYLHRAALPSGPAAPAADPPPRARALSVPPPHARGRPPSLAPPPPAAANNTIVIAAFVAATVVLGIIAYVVARKETARTPAPITAPATNNPRR